MDKLILPSGYKTNMTIRQTQKAIKFIKDDFEINLAKNLKLERISAPLFLPSNSGLNDDLGGIERAISFDIPGAGENVQIVHSLAKWKRYILSKYKYSCGEGIYADMNAIRSEENLDNIHSAYVDQWDWELVISKTDRNIDMLKKVVKIIYGTLLQTHNNVYNSYLLPKFNDDLRPPVIFPPQITFITTQQLLNEFPSMTVKERENAVTKRYGAVFLMQIGAKLSNGKVHDNRAPDYDDWMLNGDILIWYPLLGMSLELSSMGIRVDGDKLRLQLYATGCEERMSLTFHKMLLNGCLPYTIGGGIGQSRLCMLLLNRAHIGEVQASIWPESMVKQCAEMNIKFL